MVNVEDVLAGARDSMTVQRVFGEPIERGGLTIIPVARIAGGGGGGGGGGEDEAGRSGSGSGVGYGIQAEPVGAYVIKDGRLSWEPAPKALDINRIIISSHVVAIVLLLVIRGIVASRRS